MGSSHARSRLVDDLMEWGNVVIARPGSLVTTASDAGSVFLTAFCLSGRIGRKRLVWENEDRKYTVGCTGLVYVYARDS